MRKKLFEERAKRVPPGTDDKVLCTVLPEQPGVPEPGSFRVEDDQGELLCRIIRAPSRIGRRAYWRILPAMLLGGFGMAMVMTPSAAAACSGVAERRSSVCACSSSPTSRPARSSRA
jgi:hypothetical protein